MVWCFSSVLTSVTCRSKHAASSCCFRRNDLSTKSCSKLPPALTRSRFSFMIVVSKQLQTFTSVDRSSSDNKEGKTWKWRKSSRSYTLTDQHPFSHACSALCGGRGPQTENPPADPRSALSLTNIFSLSLIKPLLSTPGVRATPCAAAAAASPLSPHRATKDCGYFRHWLIPAYGNTFVA